MALTQPGTNAMSRAALRCVQELLPDAEGVADDPVFESAFGANDPPSLASAALISARESSAIPVTGALQPRFAAFLDGTQNVRIIAQQAGVPYVLGAVAAGIRERLDRRLKTWQVSPPRVDYRLYLPCAFTSPVRPATDDRFTVVDTTDPAWGPLPSRHPAALLDRAIECVKRDRESLELALAEAWVEKRAEPLCVDGGISGSARVATAMNAVGVIKSHRTIYAEDRALDVVLTLGPAERTPVFRIASHKRTPVASWYLRLRERSGRDAMWGLIRVEIAETGDVEARADEVSRWLLAEKSPLALPDGRWDKMCYGIRNSEEFLRAIA